MAKTPSQTVANLVDNFDFVLVGAGTEHPFRSYVSAVDPTAAAPGILIMGSQNVIKTLNNTIAVRPGLKLRGNADATLAGTKSSYEWSTSYGATRILRVNNSKLQVEYDSGDGNGKVWRDLMTGLTLTRMVFDPWWDNANKKDRLVFAMGDAALRSWGGGIGTIASTTATTITLNGTDAKALGFDGGQNSIFINGTTYTYTDAGYTLGTNFNQTPTTNKIAASNTSWNSQLITTGVTDSQILTATCVVNLANTSLGATVMVGALYTDNAGVPGTLITSAQAVIGNPTGTNNAGDTTIVFTFNKNILPNTNYHFVLYQQSGGAQVKAYTGSSGGVGTNISANSGTTWSAQNGYLNLVLTTNSVQPNVLVGVTPDPTSQANNSVVLQAIVTRPNVPDTAFVADFVKMVGNQAHVGSYDSRLVYVSASNDYSNYSVPTVRAPGDPDLLTLDSLCRGITVQKDKSGQNTIAVIAGGVGDWYTVGRSPLNVGTNTTVTRTEQVSVTKSEEADLATALAHEFIASVGDNIIFLDQNNQLREFGTVRNIVNPVFPLLSLDVYDELRSVDFTGGALRAVADQGGETVYITAPLSGKDYMYQIRHRLDQVGNLVAERLWQPPQIRSISRIALIDGVTYGHSTANPQMYQLWDTGQYHDDSPSGEALPYVAHAFFSYLNIGRNKLLIFGMVSAEGYMTTGTALNCTVYQNYQGSTNTPTFVLNNPLKGQKKAKFFTGVQDPSLGENSLGDNPLGDGLTVPGGADALVPKFRAIRTVTPTDVFEYALDVYSEAADAQWELLCIGANHIPSKNHPVAIRN